MSVNNGEDTSVVGNSDWLKTLVNMNTSECLHSVKFLISCNTFLKKKKNHVTAVAVLIYYPRYTKPPKLYSLKVVADAVLRCCCINLLTAADLFHCTINTWLCRRLDRLEQMKFVAASESAVVLPVTAT